MTNTTYTSEIIDGYRMNNGDINVEYFVDEITVTAINDRLSWEGITNKRRTAESVAKDWICRYINTMLYNHGYRGYSCTYPQIKKAFAHQLKTIESAVIDAVNAERSEYFEEV